MTAKAFRISTLLIALMLAGIMTWTILSDMPLWLPLAGIIGAAALKWYMRKRTTEALVDERLQSLGNRAMAISFRVFALIMVVFEIVIITMSDSLPSEFGVVGATLAYSVCGMMIIYMASYYYLAARS